jgi:thioesterase domain-containing protein/acyl carrier protein
VQTESSELTKGRPGAELNGHASAPQNGASPNGHAVLTPIAELERDLVEIWARLLRVDQVGLDDDFFDLGGHSLLGVELVYEIEEQLDRVCTLTMLFRNPTIRSLATELHAGGACATEPIVLELVEGREPPVFCICGVHVYQELAEELAPGPSLYGVFLPVEQELFAGRRGNLSVEAIARRYLAAVRESQPHGPYQLLGFCFGGILAYEMAQQLRAAGEEVSLLVMLDSTLDSGMPSHKQRLAVRLRQMAIQQGDRLPLSLQRRMLGQEWVSEANRLERARTRIYLRAMRKYQVKPYPGPAVLVKPQASAEVRLDQPDAAWGWGAHIDELQVCEVPGTHKTHLQRGNAHVVARVLRPHLDRAAEAGQPSRQHQG